MYIYIYIYIYTHIYILLRIKLFSYTIYRPTIHYVLMYRNF